MLLSLSPDLLGLEDEEVEVATQLGAVERELGGRAERLALLVAEAKPGRPVGWLLLLRRLRAPPLEEHQLDEPVCRNRRAQPCDESEQPNGPGWPTPEAALDYRDAGTRLLEASVELVALMPGVFTRVTRVPPMSTESESPACH